MAKVWLPDIVGGGYGTFWRFKGRYRALKGSRASKKSKTCALNFIYNILKYPGGNALVVRKTFRTLKDSCWAELKWAAARLKVSHLWNFTVQPLEAEYLPTGQKILFRGLDDPLKITSIAVPKGSLCWMWIEEAYEITSESDFNMLDESLRGTVEPPLFKQITLTFNPWNERHWLKKRFFDCEPNDDLLAMTVDYRKNEWLDEADKKFFEEMKIRNPSRYRVAGLGDWGIAEGVIYENWKEEAFSFEEIRKFPSAFGLDFGYTNDPSALFCGTVDTENKIIYVFDELYRKGMSNEKLYEEIYNLGYAKEKIIADSAEPKSIDRLRTLGLRRVEPARKGQGSVNAGIDFVKEFTIIVHSRCVNFINEISSYRWKKDKFGNSINEPESGYDHLMDAMRYGLEPFIKGRRWSF